MLFLFTGSVLTCTQLPSMPAQFSSPAAASPNAGWRVFPSVEVDPEEDPETSTKVKDKGKAVD